MTDAHVRSGPLRPSARVDARPRWHRTAAPAATIGVVAVASLALHLRDPHEQGSWGLCPSAAMGFWCPGCGGLRAVNDLTRLQLGAAASSNLLFVVLAPLLVYLLGRWALDAWRGVRRPVPDLTTSCTVGLLVVFVGFAVLRNLPALAWLAP